MFMKNTYENKLKETKSARPQSLEDQQAKHQSLHRKWVIGSSHYGGNINYQRDFQFFSVDDIPAEKKIANAQMSEFVDPDLLGLKKRDWNGSSRVADPTRIQEAFERKLMKLKLDFEQGGAKTTNKIYTGTETRNDYQNWNVSTAQSLQERKKQHEHERQKAMLMTNKFNQTLSEYLPPALKTSQFNQSLRQTKQSDELLRSSIRDKYKYSNPNASHQHVDGAVFRLTHEHKVKHAKPQSETEALNLTFKPDLSKTVIRPKEYNTYTHTLRTVTGVQKFGEGAATTYEPMVQSTTENYIVSTKKNNKPVDKTWVISPEEEERIRSYQQQQALKRAEQDDRDISRAQGTFD